MIKKILSFFKKRNTKRPIKTEDIEREMREGKRTNCANYWNAKYEKEKYLAKLN